MKLSKQKERKMCKPASMILTKDDVLWAKGNNSHEIIIKNNNLKDDTTSPNFVRIEITPPEKDCRPQYDAPLNKWEYRTDQDFLPKWYVASVDEERARKVLPAWYESHIVGQLTDANYITQTAGNSSTQTAGNFSTQTAGDVATQTAGNFSTQTAGNFSTQTAGINTVQICRCYIGSDYKTFFRIITEKEANKPYYFKDGVWTLIEK
jgi:hypothetical protein